MKKLLVILALGGSISSAIAQKDTAAIRFAETITAADLKEHLSIIASDEYEGRETGKKGQKMTAEYVAKLFSTYGLSAVDEGENYLQEFELKQVELASVTCNGGKLYEDFSFYGMENISWKDKDLVFVGYGIDDPAYSNYEGLDVKGKVVLFLESEPITEDGKSLITGTNELSGWSDGSNSKLEAAKKKGALGGIQMSSISDEQFKAFGDRLKHYYEKPSLGQKDEKSQTSRLAVSRTFAASLLGTSTAKLDKVVSKLADKPMAHAKVKPGKITLEMKIKETMIGTENIIGMVEGTTKPEEVIVISAHYDHIGVMGDKVYNGADDDGSGTVAVIELAQAFSEAKKAGFGPQRSIVFMGMTGEEKGLLGSEYYSEHPIFPLENTVTNLNIDMIGRLDEAHADNENYVYLIGTNMLSQELHDISEQANATYKNIGLDYTFNDKDDPNRFYYRSDHYNFAKHGVPVIFYFNGVHEDYHKHTDTVDKILFDKMENITQLVFYTAWEIANRENRPLVDKTSDRK